MPTNANWPRLMWPPQPVMITSDTPAMAATMAKTAPSWLPMPNVDGTQASSAPATTTKAYLT
jgi:hypothetical protein